MKNKRTKVLLIEDDKVDQLAFKRLVKEKCLSYDYTIVQSLSETKKILDHERFDVVIADYFLGDGASLDIFDLIFECPIIVTTGLGNEKIAVKAMKAGAYDYIVKDPECKYINFLPLTIEKAIKCKKIEQEIELQSHAIMSANDSVYITDKDDKIIFVNTAFCRAYGYEKENILGKSIRLLWDQRDFKEGANSKQYVRVRRRKGEFINKRKDGSKFPVSLSRSVIKDKKGNKVAVVQVAHDITRPKRVEEAWRRLSFLDGLTGIPNRRNFDGFIDLEWRQAIRGGAPLSLIMIDIDNFKEYNDTYGHHAGDKCLKQVAKLLSASLKRPRDLLARYGGEEFVIVLPGTDEIGAYLIAKLLRSQIEALKIAHSSSSASKYVTISLGVATITPIKNSRPEEIIKKADQALYQAKQEGKNQVNVFNLK